MSHWKKVTGILKTTVLLLYAIAYVLCLCLMLFLIFTSFERGDILEGVFYAVLSVVGGELGYEVYCAMLRGVEDFFRSVLYEDWKE